MGFLGNVVSAFKDAAKAGGEFNPVLEGVLKQIEILHSEGKLGDVVYKAEQAYTKEHEAYTAKGARTDAADSQNDVRALAHFMDTLKQEKANLDPAVQAQVETLLALKDKMENILGNALKK